MSNITMRSMLEAGVHFGHQTRYWNPKMEPYIFGQRNKVHIINLEKTLPMYLDAVNFIGKLALKGGIILFVGTKRSAQKIIQEEAERCNMPYVSVRWLGGLLTNYQTVRQSIAKMQTLEAMQADGTVAKMSKKDQMRHKHSLKDMMRGLSGIKDMNILPDALFVIDIGYEKIAVSEAIKLSIPIVGVVDSNNNPDNIDYVIPGNDDANRSIRLYTQGISDAILNSQQLMHQQVSETNTDEFVELDGTGNPITVQNVSIREKKTKAKLSIAKDSAEEKTSAEEKANETVKTSDPVEKSKISQNMLVVLKQPEIPYRENSARAEYWKRFSEFDGKLVADLKDSVENSPPSVPEKGTLKGKQEPLSGWINFFKKEGLIELKADESSE